MVARKPEQLVNDRIERSIGKCPWVDAKRVENRAGGNGWPDWFLFFIKGGKGQLVMLETKAYHKWTPEQRNFALQRVAQNFRLYLVQGTPEDTTLIQIVFNPEKVDKMELVHVARYGTTIPTREFLDDLGIPC